MTSSSFVSPLDCLTSFLGISLSRAVSSFGLPVYSSIHSRCITKCPKIGHYGRVVFLKLAEAAGNARGVPNAANPHPYLSSLPILAVVYRFFYLFYLPTANLPIYHNLPISTDFFADLPNFNFFYRSFCYFM